MSDIKDSFRIMKKGNDYKIQKLCKCFFGLKEKWVDLGERFSLRGFRVGIYSSLAEAKRELKKIIQEEIDDIRGWEKIK